MLTVRVLYNFHTNSWNLDTLQNLFTATSIEQIQQLAPTLQAETPDKLIWKPSPSGRITLKLAYQHLMNSDGAHQGETHVNNHLGGRIWAIQQIQPKIKAFMWKIAHCALPTLYELHRRTRRGTSTCPRCQLENETINHMLYTCTVSRAVWFMSPLGLRADAMHLQPMQALQWALQNLSSDAFILFANIAWAIWKSRNEFIFRRKEESPSSIIAEGVALSQLAVKQHSGQQSSHNKCPITQERGVMWDRQMEAVCMVDGSWDCEGRSGIAASLFCHKGKLQHVIAQPTQATGPFFAEVAAMQLALKLLLQMAIQGKILICSDCLDLVEYLTSGEDCFIKDWRAIPMLQECTAILRTQGQRIRIRHISRNYNEISHKLANLVRVSHNMIQGYPSPQLVGQLGLSQELPAVLFSS